MCAAGARELARYEVDGQEIVLTDRTIRNVICDNPRVTDREVMLFAALCKAQGLNPFVRDAHLIKYGDNPATMVVGKDTFVKRAAADPRFRGFRAGITVIDRDGALTRREGSMCGGRTERLVGGWCEVHVDGYDVPMFDEVSLEEYTGRKKDGTPSGQWARMPATMIRKVAIVHALREAFPDQMRGLYDASEMGVEPSGPGPEAALGTEVPEVPEAGPEPEEVPVDACGFEEVAI